MNEPTDLAALQSELSRLRAEVQSLRQILAAPLHLRVASLEIVGEASNGADSRFRVKLAIEEHGGALHFLDSQAGTTGHQAALMATDEGVSLALCGENGTPRAVLSARQEGGGASFVDQNGKLAAEIFGAGEASWLMLNHNGTTRAVSVATQEGGNLELFDERGAPRVVLPPHTEGAYSPQ